MISFYAMILKYIFDIEAVIYSIRNVIFIG